MKVLIINSVCGVLSTGRICTDLAEMLEKQGCTVKIAHGREDVPAKYRGYAVRIGTDLGVRFSALHTRLTDKHGFANRWATRRFLKWADAYDPDVLWLHNLHGYYIHVGMLFNWIKSRPNMQIKWTLHDCWAFTGHCAHFTYTGCDRWQRGCRNCPETRQYPAAFTSNCERNYRNKRAVFTGVKHMTLITPSRWLADLTRGSFLAKYPVEVSHNTIDRSIFKPTPGDFRQRYGLESQKLILGVASAWGERKGFNDFIRLAHRIPDSYRIIMVGVSENQKKMLPDNVLGITRTDSPAELAQIYTASDVFVNLTYEDTYPTVNLEAQACGTPAITYRTGGSVESVPSAQIVDAGDMEGLIRLILRICENSETAEFFYPNV